MKNSTVRTVVVVSGLLVVALGGYLMLRISGPDGLPPSEARLEPGSLAALQRTRQGAGSAPALPKEHSSRPLRPAGASRDDYRTAGGDGGRPQARQSSADADRPDSVRLIDAVPNVGPGLLLEILGIDGSVFVTLTDEGGPNELDYKIDESRSVRVDANSGHLIGYLNLERDHGTEIDERRITSDEAMKTVESILSTMDMDILLGDARFSPDAYRMRYSPHGVSDAGAWRFDASLEYDGLPVLFPMMVSVCAATGRAYLFRTAVFVPPDTSGPTLARERARSLAGAFLGGLDGFRGPKPIARKAFMDMRPANNFWTRGPGESVEYGTPYRRIWNVRFGSGIGTVVFVDADTGDIVGGYN